MPTEYVRSGPDTIRDGVPVTPLGAVHKCEGCGYVGAPFGIKRGDEVLSYCGWVDGLPTCVGKGRANVS